MKAFVLPVLALAIGAGAQVVSQSASNGLQPSDVYKLRSVSDVQLSANGRLVAYSVQTSEGRGAPSSHVMVRDTASGREWRLESPAGAASGPRWSPDGTRVAFFGRDEEQGSSLMIARVNPALNVGPTDVRVLAGVRSTNHPLPSTGERLAWSPDGRSVAFVSTTEGPERDQNGDPMVVTRYLYKPTASEGRTRFNDNRRTHIFVVGVDGGAVRQITDGTYYEHSIDWSPRGDEIAFISNRESDPDRFFNYDIFAVKVADGAIRRLTATKSAEYRPVWSPDGRTIAYLGTTRPLTSSETTMEDTHVWLLDADGANRRELGKTVDNRQGMPRWSPDGRRVFCTVQERGSTRLYALSVDGGRPELLTPDAGAVGAWDVTDDGRLLYAFSSQTRPSELFVRSLNPGTSAITQLTRVNENVLAARAIAAVESFSFRSFDATEIEAFLTLPLGRTASSRHPVIVMIHGGPHGQQGPAFNSKAQIYAARGWASLMVNFRGSTGYGQKLADAIFKDQNGGEARDVVDAVDAALTRYPWIDADRLGIEGGSYGGQLVNWIITRTDRFRAAIPSAGISNLVSFNYMAYYHDYLAVEFGAFPHEQGISDLLWERSPLRYASKVRTPTLFVHGENDNDVPIAEAEQFYIALKDVGVETIMVRYPREGHGIRETGHVVDVIERSISWYSRHFARRSASPSH